MCDAPDELNHGGEVETSEVESVYRGKEKTSEWRRRAVSIERALLLLSHASARVHESAGAATCEESGDIRSATRVKVC